MVLHKKALLVNLLITLDIFLSLVNLCFGILNWFVYTRDIDIDIEVTHSQMLHGPAKLCSVKSSKFACSRNYSMYSNVSYEPYGIRGCLPKKHGLSSFAHLRFTVPAFLLPNHPHRSCYDENKIQTISHKTSKSQVVTTCTPKLALILIIIPIQYRLYKPYVGLYPTVSELFRSLHPDRSSSRAGRCSIVCDCGDGWREPGTLCGSPVVCTGAWWTWFWSHTMEKTMQKRQKRRRLSSFHGLFNDLDVVCIQRSKPDWHVEMQVHSPILRPFAALGSTKHKNNNDDQRWKSW